MPAHATARENGRKRFLNTSTGERENGGSTFVCEGLVSSFFPCADAAAAAATGLDSFAGSTLGASAFTAAAAVL